MSEEQKLDVIKTLKKGKTGKARKIYEKQKEAIKKINPL